MTRPKSGNPAVQLFGTLATLDGPANVRIWDADLGAVLAGAAP
jgi:hypothetical protein